MWVKVKKKGKVYYDAEQKKTVDDKRTYEVKATSLIRELVRTNDLIEAEKPSDVVIKKYAAEDVILKGRKEKLAKKTGVGQTVAAQLKKSQADLIVAKGELETLEVELVEANENLVKANLEIDSLKELTTKVGDLKSQEVKDLEKKKEDAVDPKKETAKTLSSEKA